MNNVFNPIFGNKFRNKIYSNPHFCKEMNLPPPKCFDTLNNPKNSFYKDNENFTKTNNCVPKFKPIFEFNGLKLYSDDLLILALIYFLYKEEIKDTLLFIALFSLLFN